VLVLELSELLVDIRIVDFAGAGFVAARNVGNMDQTDDVDVLVQFFYEIALSDLLMEEVVQKLNLRMVDGANDFDSFRG